MSISWGDLPTWVAAVGTVGTLGAALLQIEVERRRRTKQELEDREERHRSQARLIAGWAGPGDQTYEDGWMGGEGATPIYMVNSSQEPVYNVVVGVVHSQGTAPKTGEEWRTFKKGRDADGGYFVVPFTTLSILPPGRWKIWIKGSSWTGGLGGRSAAEVAFTDSGGSHWVRRGTGKLEELKLQPFQHFELDGPYDLQPPQPF